MQKLTFKVNRSFLHQYADMNDRNVNPKPKLYIVYTFNTFDKFTQCFKLQ